MRILTHPLDAGEAWAGGAPGFTQRRPPFQFLASHQAAPDLTWVGRVSFSEGTSVNFVSGDKERMYVAGGLGGLKIVAYDAG